MAKACVAIERPPDEVLALIFKAAADLPLLHNESPPPLAISRVSQRWRAVSLSSPQMWTTIRISARQSLLDANLFLERSVPVRFRLSVDTTQGMDMKLLLCILSPHLQRCSALALCLSDEDMCIWNTVLGKQEKLHTLRSLSITVHSYAPDELWGPPDSLYQLTKACSGVSTLRLSGGPTMRLQEQLHPLQLTTLDVRCTWDGAFVRHICHHSRVLQTLVLRDYSATVFDSAAPTYLPSLESLALEYRDATLAEGLINLALFLDLPSLSRLFIKGSGTPGVGHPLRHWCARPFPCLRVLHLHGLVLHRPIDASVLQSLCAEITELEVINVHRGFLEDPYVWGRYSNLRILEALETKEDLPPPIRQTDISRPTGMRRVRLLLSKP
ncbi:hypothetical protein DFH06DRAFT_1122361 [Mycena polygramma]|nr:hypothetical protein DFH06DRAFT_1122361 [Mycena polygramma]